MATENNNKNLNVPNLRFPEFSGEWKQYRLGDLVEIRSGVSPSGVVEDIGEFPFYKVEQLNNCHIKLGATPYWTKQSAIPADSIVFPKRGAAIMTNKIRISTRPCQIDTNLMALTVVNNEKFDFKFIYHFIDRCNLSKIADTSTIPQINNIHINPLKIRIPSFDEQKKISTLFTILDERIETQIKVIEDLKKLKSAISIHLFESNDCERVKLSDIATVQMGQSPSSQSYNEEERGLPLIQGNLDLQDGRLTPRVYTSEITQQCEAGDVILTVRAPVGEIAIAKFNACIGRGVCAIRPKRNADTMLIYQYLQYYKPKWASLEQGSTFTSVGGADIRSIHVNMPSPRAIKLLEVLEHKVTVEQNTLSILVKQKQYLLAQLFI